LNQKTRCSNHADGVRWLVLAECSQDRFPAGISDADGPVSLAMEKSGIVAADAGSVWANRYKLAAGRRISMIVRMAVRNSGL
jgi:hypothetical protein